MSRFVRFLSKTADRIRNFNPTPGQFIAILWTPPAIVSGAQIYNIIDHNARIKEQLQKLDVLVDKIGDVVVTLKLSEDQLLQHFAEEEAIYWSEMLVFDPSRVQARIEHAKKNPPFWEKIKETEEWMALEKELPQKFEELGGVRKFP